VTNFPDSGSPERVAMDLVTMVYQHEGQKKMSRTEILDLYVECWKATTGRRA
jgi:hypothetical protein